MKLRWYADNSEMHGSRSAPIQDVFLFGGIIVDHEQEGVLRQRLEDIKEAFGLSSAPVKWNFRDLKEHYARANAELLYKALLQNSDEWRREMLRVAIDTDVKVVIACIEAYSLQRKIIKLRKQDIAQYAFSNALQRVALHSKQSNATSCELILDWPDRGDPQPFCREFFTAFKNGKTSGGQPYLSGPLASLGFVDSPMFQTMETSSLLQLADLTVGAVREFVEYALGKRPAGLGTELTKELRTQFYGAPRNLCGWGLVIAGSAEFRHKIKEKANAELLGSR